MFLFQLSVLCHVIGRLLMEKQSFESELQHLPEQMYINLRIYCIFILV